MGSREGDCSWEGRERLPEGRGICRPVSSGDGKKGQVAEVPMTEPSENVRGERGRDWV